MVLLPSAITSRTRVLVDASTSYHILSPTIRTEHRSCHRHRSTPRSSTSIINLIRLARPGGLQSYEHMPMTIGIWNTTMSSSATTYHIGVSHHTSTQSPTITSYHCFQLRILLVIILLKQCRTTTPPTMTTYWQAKE